MATYTVILALYLAPIAASFFGNTYFPQSPGTKIVNTATITSPFAAAFNVPLYMDDLTSGKRNWNWAQSGTVNLFGYPLADLQHFGGYCLFTVTLNSILFGLMIWMFHSRWRVSTSTG